MSEQNHFYTKIEHQFSRSKEYQLLTLSERKVFDMLKDRNNSKNTGAWITTDDAKWMELSDKRVRDSLVSLCRIGFIIKVQNYSPGKRASYKINYDFVSKHSLRNYQTLTNSLSTAVPNSLSTAAQIPNSLSTAAQIPSSVSTAARRLPTAAQIPSSLSTAAQITPRQPPGGCRDGEYQDTLSINSINNGDSYSKSSNAREETVRDPVTRSVRGDSVRVEPPDTLTDDQSIIDTMNTKSTDPVFNRTTGLWEGVDESNSSSRAPFYKEISNTFVPCDSCEEIIRLGLLPDDGVWVKIDPVTHHRHECPESLREIIQKRKILMEMAEEVVEDQRANGISYHFQSHRDFYTKNNAIPEVPMRACMLAAAKKDNPSQSGQISKNPKYHISNAEIARYFNLPYSTPQSVPLVVPQRPKQHKEIADEDLDEEMYCSDADGHEDCEHQVPNLTKIKINATIH